METGLIILNTLYCFFVFLVLIVFLKKQKINPVNDQPFISVVIAARNEENRIRPTIDSLAKVKYPKDKYEVIFVDDASQDNTANQIEACLKENSNWQLIRITKKGSKLKGKKSALKQAIEKAQGEIILTTDADCIVPENWLSEMASCFDEKTTMVLGHSLLIKRKGWLDKLLRFDNLFSGILVAAPTLLGFPLSSVGRNMAYKKSAYQKSGGYDELSQHKSGDDVHLTELFREKLNGRIVFNLKKDSFTSSKTPDSFGEIIHQQIRKNSKILKKSLPTIALTIFLLTYHLLLVIFPFSTNGSLNTWLSLIAVKFLSEFITLSVAAKKLSDPLLIPLIPIMQIFYPVYVSILGLAGIFQKYEWKK